MAIDMNVDVGALIKGLFSKKDINSGDKGQSNPFIKVILVVVVVLILIFTYIFLHYLPTQDDLRIKNQKISQVSNLKIEIIELKSLIDKSILDLNIAEKDYQKLTNLFHTDKELEDLYRHISMLALRNNLMVSKIEKGGERPILEMQADSSQSIDSNYEFIENDSSIRSKVAYYEFVVNFEISGNYNNYVKFKKGLSELKKIINLKTESVIVLESETRRGEVRVISSIATYRFPIDDAETYIDPNEEF